MKRIQLAIAAATLFAGVGSAHAQLVFNNTVLAGTSAQALQGFLAAEARWSAIFKDNVTINLTIGTASLGSGIIGQTSSTQNNYSYSSVRSALIADSKSASDAIAVANLQAGPNFAELINYTKNNPNGVNSATPYLDNTGGNTSSIYMTNANAKALGLRAAAASGNDASVTFSSNFSFDYDPTNGISAGTLDFVGVATHEIGHALGFISGVDYVDFYGQAGQSGVYNDDDYDVVSTLDLFRFSAASKAAHAIDFTAGNGPKYFSLDGGNTVGPGFSTGSYLGDGSQASHWKDNLGIGIMDPTAAFGELLSISANDIMAFDAIGWDVTAAVPEPSTYAMFGLGLAAMAFVRRRKQQQQA